MSKITFGEMPISTPPEKAFECRVRDRELIDHTCKFAKILREQGVEVFERQDNVLATSNGYYVAMFTEDLRSQPGGIDNPIPFTGKDGRMKINVVRENGEVVVEDLATLVAMAFCPNPEKYSKTWFKDGNPENCNGDNIYWVSDLKYLWIILKYKIKNIFK